MHNHSKQPCENGPVRVLVVEDNPVNQLVLRAILESARYTVDVVKDGRVAIDALESDPFDVVLMDCSMPVMDGFSATRAIRSRESRVIDRNIPIIALTSFSTEDDKQKCMQAGMNEYVSKPADPLKLIRAIERCRAAVFQPDPIMGDAIFSEDTGSAVSALNPEVLDDFIEKFSLDFPNQITDLQEALISGCGDTIAAIGHKIRGTADLIGAGLISTLANTIEKASRADELDRVYVIAPKLLEEMQRLLDELASAESEEGI